MPGVLFNPLTFWFSRHYRPRVFTFRPPKNNRLVIELTKGVLPLILRLGIRVKVVEIREGDLKNLEGLKGQRVILTPSHSGGFESFVLFHLSKLMGKEFNHYAMALALPDPLNKKAMARLGSEIALERYGIVASPEEILSLLENAILLCQGDYKEVVDFAIEQIKGKIE